VSDALSLSDFDFELADHTPEFLTWPFRYFAMSSARASSRDRMRSSIGSFAIPGYYPEQPGRKPARKAPARPGYLAGFQNGNGTGSREIAPPLYANGQSSHPFG
jgi:hypothetical protein